MSEVFSRRVAIVIDFLDSIGSLQFDAAGRILTADAVMTLPFVEGLPPTHGRSSIVDQLRSTIPLMFERMNFSYDKWYDVCDEDTVIAEYHSECHQLQGLGVYRNTYITVFQFEGDKIALYKEFLNPSLLMAVTLPGDAVDDDA